MTFRPTPPSSDFAHNLELLLRLQGKRMAAIARERQPDRRDEFIRQLAIDLEAELVRSGWTMTKARPGTPGASVGRGGLG